VVRVRFRVLGDVQALDGDREVRVPAGRVRALLTMLLLNANRAVSVDELVERLWPQAPPAHPRAAVQTVVRRLRRALGDGVVRTEADGYSIAAGPGELDLEEFRWLVARACAAGDAEERAALLRVAVGLWRGDPAHAGEQAPRLLEERLHATELWFDARLRLGSHVELVEPLSRLTREHPLRERFWAQLIVALRRSGRRGEAERAYRTVSRLLAEELGIDPGDELRAALGVSGPRWTALCQLPMDPAGIVGRDGAVARIRDALRPGTTVPVLTITGPPGVGKSALAVRSAHALREEFPDGQWYLRLGEQGPAELLDALLRNAGVEPAAIPADEQQRAARLRAHLADRRVLLLLDDATGSAQVRPLLPGTPGCAVIVTSRRELDGLAASHGARSFPVSPLTPDEGVSLLALALGTARVATEPEAARDLVGRCGGLPLALRIAAANLAARPAASLATYVTRLRGADPLGQLASRTDPDLEVRTAFALSYDALDAALRRTFRLLGLLPGPDADPTAAAALLGIAPTADARNAGAAALDGAALETGVLEAGALEAERLLDGLAAANVVERRGVDRYGLHDLIRVYAAERVALEEARPELDAARSRLLTWYLRRAEAAIAARYPHAARRAVPDNPDDAWTWLNAERPNLVAAATDPVFLAAGSWRLTTVLRPYLDSQCHLTDWSRALDAALAAPAATAPDRALLLGDRGVLRLRLGRPRDAVHDFEAALGLLAEQEPGRIAGIIRNNLAVAHLDLAEPRRAREHLLRVLDRQRRHAADDHFLASLVHCNLGLAHLDLGEPRTALTHLDSAEAVTSAGPNAFVTGLLHEVRGQVHLALGDHDTADTHFHQALALFRNGGYRPDECLLLSILAETNASAGRTTAALDHARAALTLAEDLANPRCLANAHNALAMALLEATGGDGRTAGGGDAAAHFRAALDLSVAADHLKGRITALVGLTRATGDPQHAAAAAALARAAGLATLEALALTIGPRTPAHAR
jgi:DNA-binding SARP family transcriptional activator/tetratricopeptide (TPR) repeat protein